MSVARLALRGTCPVGSATGTASAAGSGLAATIMASGTGILGCCGPGFSGWVLALLGVGAGTAHTLPHFSPAIQVVVIALFAVGYVRLRRRVRRAGPRPVLGEARGSA